MGFCGSIRLRRLFERHIAYLELSYNTISIASRTQEWRLSKEKNYKLSSIYCRKHGTQYRWPQGNFHENYMQKALSKWGIHLFLLQFHTDNANQVYSVQNHLLIQLLVSVEWNMSNKLVACWNIKILSQTKFIVKVKLLVAIWSYT